MDVRWRAALIDGCLDAIVSVSPDGAVVTWNAAAEHLYGYPAADMIGYPLSRIIDAVSAPAQAALACVASGTPMPATDVLCMRRDGHVIEVSLTISPVRDEAGAFLGATVIGRDVSATRNAERRLREGEIHLRSVVDTAADGIIAITSLGMIESVNPAAERLFGYSAEEMIGNNVRMLMPAPFCHEHDGYLESFGRTGVAKVIGIGREVIGRRKDGSVFPMELAVSAMRVGEAQKFTGIVRDITERKQAEDEVRIYLSEVEDSRDRMSQQAELLAAQTEELADARDLAETATRAKGDFLAVMSHEIRTPMNGVIGLAELLRGTNLDEDQRHCVDTIVRSGEALLSIINDVLDFSKLEAGRIDLEAVTFDMRGLFEDVADLFAAVASRRGIELVCDVALDVPEEFTGDPNRVRQILTNLVSNALKFTERGEVVIRLARDELAGESVLRGDVTDTGVGIAADGLSRLFRSFSQAEASTARKYGGTGLGLAISKQLVESMGGGIGVRSEFGAGTTFSFTLPCTAPPAARTLDLPDLAGRRLLVVDDNGTSRGLVARLLTAAAGRVEAVGDAIEALAQLEAATAIGDPFDLAVIDYHADDEAMASFCRAIGHAEGTTHTPFVVLSTSALKLRDDVRALGACGVVSKPVRAARLFEAVHRGIASRVDPPAPAGQDRSPLLTVSDAASTTAPDDASSRVRSTGCYRILAADDNEVNRLVLRRMLERLGHEVEMVVDGEEAVKAYEDGGWDIVLMDCSMPRLDGFGAAEAMRSFEARTRTSRTPILAVTASIRPADAERCRQSGMDGCLMKPIVMGQLQAAIVGAVRAADPA